MSDLDLQNQHNECNRSYTGSPCYKISEHQGQPHLKLEDNGVTLK